MQKVAGTVKKNPMVYLTTFVRPSLTRGTRGLGDLGFVPTEAERR